MIEIKFSVKEYKNLLKMVYLGNLIINSGTNSLIQFDDLQAKLLRKASEVGLEDYCSEEEPFCPSPILEDEVDEYIGEYEESNFWFALPEKMAERYLAICFSEEELNKMDPRKRYMIKTNLTAKFKNEFEENGLQNVNFSPELKKKFLSENVEEV